MDEENEIGFFDKILSQMDKDKLFIVLLTIMLIVGFFIGVVGGIYATEKNLKGFIAQQQEFYDNNCDCKINNEVFNYESFSAIQKP